MVTSVGPLTHTVPGVVSVVNRLGYEYDDTTTLGPARALTPFSSAGVAV